jgi:hypothetical protein
MNSLLGDQIVQASGCSYTFVLMRCRRDARRKIIYGVSLRGSDDLHQWGNEQAWRVLTASGKYHLINFQSSRKLKMYYYCQKYSAGGARSMRRRDNRRKRPVFGLRLRS